MWFVLHPRCVGRGAQLATHPCRGAGARGARVIRAARALATLLAGGDTWTVIG
jgi:hypothetical protein